MMSELGDRQQPAFDEPWHAQAYAMSQVLIESGRITPGDWAAALGNAIKTRLASGAPDTTDSYFAAITDALESVLAVKEQEINHTVEAWRDAYETTPHGKPVKLKTGKPE
ncbi:nitrile hydratase accessory protein [Pelagibius sp. Alg239-R121]|uniref:nitrile hydratase accessory protein n=1 Tax=Pelagibius sp. Alg239-R121 TaxID=2993448 RepID=UPI0024A6E093|nr:nitrile hydratase accessory protein [Pelagibius sp. Alg239-R121]